MSRYKLFDRSRLCLRPLSERQSEVTVRDCLPLAAETPAFDHPELGRLVEAIARARKKRRPVIWMVGAHVIKQGLSRFLVDLIDRGVITHLATNGAGVIHDFELALHGATSEDVARYIRRGEFGMWRETGQINGIVQEAAQQGEGLGEAVGRVIETDRFPHRELSICAAGWRCGVPVTAHVGVGSDIIHQHPSCNGAALGAASYTDFLIFAAAIEQLEGGVFLNIGSAVTGPEVYLKALSMARNVARQQQRQVARFTTAVFDLVPLPTDCRSATPSKAEAGYYFRPWKTILVRTVADGGESFYFCGDHRATVPTLHRRITEALRRAARDRHAAA